jgi:hypothetical protein
MTQTLQELRKNKLSYFERLVNHKLSDACEGKPDEERQIIIQNALVKYSQIIDRISTETNLEFSLSYEDLWS